MTFTAVPVFESPYYVQIDYIVIWAGFELTAAKPLNTVPVGFLSPDVKLKRVSKNWNIKAL